MIERHMGRGLRGVGLGVEDAVVGADGEHEARPERMGRAQQIAEIDGLGDALDADGEIAAAWNYGPHASCLPQAARAQKGENSVGGSTFPPLLPILSAKACAGKLLLPENPFRVLMSAADDALDPKSDSEPAEHPRASLPIYV